MLGRDVIAVGAQPAEVGGAGPRELDPPVRQVGRHLDPDARHQPARLGDQSLHVLDVDLAGPGGRVLLRAVPHPGAPVLTGGRVGDLGRLASVVLLVGDVVLEDHFLDVAVALVQLGQSRERGHPLVLGLADPNQDPARERDLELAGGRDGLDPSGRVLGRGALVDD
jgi:hypothetical protein